jgi:hypothetical protein
MMRRKKPEAKQEQSAPQTTPATSAVKASVKNMGNGELSLAGGNLSFILKKGRDVAIKIPVEFIEEKRQEGNQLVIVHSGITDRFTLQNAEAPKTMIEMLTVAQANVPEAPQTEPQEAPALELPEQPAPSEQPLPEAAASEPEPVPEAPLPQQITEEPAKEPEALPEQTAPEQQEPEKEEPQPQASPEQTEPQLAPEEQALESEAILTAEAPEEPATEPEAVAEQKPAEPPAPEESLPEESSPQIMAEPEVPPPTLTAEQEAPPIQPEKTAPEVQAPTEPALAEKPAPQKQATPQPTPAASVVKASVKNMGNGELELAGGNLTFSVKKGFLGKTKKVAIKIPLESIEDKRQEGNQLVIVWNGITDRFTLKDADEPKAMLGLLASTQTPPAQPQQEPNQVTQAKAEPEAPIKPTPEEATTPKHTVQIQLPDVPEYGFPEPPITPEPEPLPMDVSATFNMVADIADPLFDLIRGLQGKVNWKSEEENLIKAKEKSAILTDQTQAEVILNFSRLNEAVKAHVPGEVAAEAFTLLKALQAYVDGLAPQKPEVPGRSYPNYKSLQTALHAYFTLNDVAFAMELGDEDVVKEGFEFARIVDQLSKDTHSIVNTQPLKDAVSKLARETGTEISLVACRVLFRDQFEDQSKSFRHYSKLLEAVLSTEA